MESQVIRLMEAKQSRLGYESALSLVVMLWMARAGVGALIGGLNIVYRVIDRRYFFWNYVVAYILTLVLIFFAAIALAFVVLLPGLMAAFPESGLSQFALHYIRWPLLFVSLIFVLGFLYRYGPDEPRPRFAWFSVGSILAIVLWIAASWGFSYYVRNFASYDATYGTLGAVVGLLMWLYISAFIILIGAEVNAQIEFHIYGEPRDRDPAFRRRPRLQALLERRRNAANQNADDPAPVVSRKWLK
jgi:membrane protein